MDEEKQYYDGDAGDETTSITHEYLRHATSTLKRGPPRARNERASCATVNASTTCSDTSALHPTMRAVTHRLVCVQRARSRGCARKQRTKASKTRFTFEEN